MSDFRAATLKPGDEYRGEPLLAEFTGIEVVDDEETGSPVLVVNLYDGNSRLIAATPFTIDGADVFLQAVSVQVLALHRMAGRRAS